MMATSFYDIIGFEQTLRWKDEYPDWRLPAKKIGEIKGKNIPNFCGRNESMYKWMIFFLNFI